VGATCSPTPMNIISRYKKGIGEADGCWRRWWRRGQAYNAAADGECVGRLSKKGEGDTFFLFLARVDGGYFPFCYV